MGAVSAAEKSTTSGCLAASRTWRVLSIVALVGCVACAPSNGRERAPSAPGLVAPADAGSDEAEISEPTDAGLEGNASDAGPAEARADMDPRLPAGGALRSRADAIRVFKKVWLEHAAAHIDRKQPKVASGWSDVLARKGQPIDATREDCGAARERILSTFAPGERPAVLFGAHSRLTDRQSCWVVAVPAGFYTLLGYLSESEGELLLVWVPPEG